MQNRVLLLAVTLYKGVNHPVNPDGWLTFRKSGNTIKDWRILYGHSQQGNPGKIFTASVLEQTLIWKRYDLPERISENGRCHSPPISGDIILEVVTLHRSNHPLLSFSNVSHLYPVQGMCISRQTANYNTRPSHISPDRALWNIIMISAPAPSLCQHP